MIMIAPRNIFTVASWGLLLMISFAGAFHVPSSLRIHHQTTVLPSSLSNNNAQSDEMIRKDIEAMREEAKERLQHLNEQMEDMLRKHQVQSHEKEHDFLHPSAFEKAIAPPAVVDHSATAKHPVISVKNIPKQSARKAVNLEKEAVKVPSSTAVVVPPPSHFIDSSLLHDTRWKIVIKVGSVQQNEVLEGIEKPLLVHLVVDFTSEPLLVGDDLLQGKSNVLVVKESWIGASSTTEGSARDVTIKSTGGWKILPGQGPKGIDILRFYIDVEEEICHDRVRSTLRCPAERIYFTSGIFSMDHHNESEAFKDSLRGELDRLMHKYEDLTLEDERDERFFSLDGVKRAKQMMEIKQQIKATNKKITQARIRDPEKAMLRLSRRRDLGVTREGQVCYRQTKGTSAEYTVLGKMEMASVDKPIIESISGDSTNELRP